MIRQAALLLLSIRCVAPDNYRGPYIHIAIQHAAALLNSPGGYQVIIC